MYTITAALALSFALFSLKAFHTFILVSLHICYLVLHAHVVVQNHHMRGNHSVASILT